jgi:hypothetical protein
LLLLIVGQVLALAHEAEARHMRCAEHGELLEVASAASIHDDGSGQSHLIAIDGDAGDKHQECVIARLLRTDAHASFACHLHVTATEIVLVEPIDVAEHPRAVDIISLAPKTSPPA